MNQKTSPVEVPDLENENEEDVSCGGLCMRRRDVLIAGAVGSAAVAMYPHAASAGPATGTSISTYPRLKVAALADLIEGEGVAFNYPLNDQPNMLVKLGKPAQNGAGADTDIVAFSVLCPHMGGSLRGRYQHEHGAMGPCPFHFSTFDLTKGGVPVHASATQNLPQVRLETDGVDVFAVGMTGLIYGYRDNLADGVITDGAELPDDSGKTMKG